jgi:hypothetical protein
MRVELLYWDEDPDYMRTRQNLVEVLTEDAFETPIQMVAVGSEADAALLGFPGSPTIRIDGRDVHPESADRIGLHLRRYPAEGGGESSVPGKEIIRRGVERARGWGHARRG